MKIFNYQFSIFNDKESKFSGRKFRHDYISNSKFQIPNYKCGFVFLEILIAVALISIVFITLLGIAFSTVRNSTSVQSRSRADSLIKEEIEAVRAFRDSTTWVNFKNVNFGWSNYYYFALSNNQWSRNSGTETIDGFTRGVIFEQVYRDANGNISSSGTLDNDTIKVTATVSWISQTMQAATYLTNWQNK